MVSSLIRQVFTYRKPIIAMIHIFRDSKKRQIFQALEDLERLQFYVDGVIVENYDCGYLDGNLATEEMAEILTEIAITVVKNSRIPVGVNVLPNDYEKAFQIAHIAGGKFIQLDHVTGEFTGCKSVDPQHFLSVRSLYPNIAVLGGIHPKYYKLVDSTIPIANSASKARELVDVLVITGKYTGGETYTEDIYRVKGVVGDFPVFVGSGINAENVRTQLSVADGAIVGTATKKGGVRPGEKIDTKLVKKLMDEVAKLRGV